MTKKMFVKKFWLVTVLSLILTISSTSAFAWGGRDRDDRGDRRSQDRGSHGREVVMVGHQRYHYQDGRFFRPSWFGLEFFVVTPPVGAIVVSIPIGHRTMIIGGATYYYYNNVYYRPCPSGYIVVPEPTVNSNVVYAPATVRTQALSGETVTINVPNSNGSYTPIMLVKHNNGYIGPQGEYYSGNPTVEQLRALYGK
jgi:hypothetical protein